MKNIFALFFLIIFSSCGYNSLYKNAQSDDFKINVISITGDDEINKFIKKGLELRSSNSSKNVYDLSIETNYNKLILSKDTSGVATDYQVFVDAIFKINFNKQSEIFSFTESVKMKKISDSLEELSYEKNIKNNFSQSLQNKLILKLNNFR